MKTGELSGPLLDYWVAMAENRTPRLGQDLDGLGLPVCAVLRLPDNGADPWWGIYRPRDSWGQGGPLLERAGIYVQEVVSGADTRLHWIARRYPQEHTGATYLEAGMRVFVALVYGDTVPDEAQ